MGTQTFQNVSVMILNKKNAQVLQQALMFLSFFFFF